MTDSKPPATPDPLEVSPSSPSPRPAADPSAISEILPGSSNTTIVHTPPLALAGVSPRSAQPATSSPGSEPGGGPRLQPDAAAGESVGEYELIEELARGGMGVVYKARHRKLGRLVALKMIRALDLVPRGDVERFHIEAKAAAQLEHPNIVPIYDVGEYAGRPYFTMRLIEGGNLAAHLAEIRGNGRVIAGLLAPVARAVHHAHQHGILHRDLKPANILLDPRHTPDSVTRSSPSDSARSPAPSQPPAPVFAPATGSESDWVPFVTDFGLAKRFDVDNRMTQSGAVMGTPAYIPPEQASGERGRVCAASDVYALGAILYEALTGRPPFTGSSVGDILYQVLETEPTPPRSIDPALDRDLETICLKCLEKNPARRYASAADLADELQRWLNHEPIEARPTGTWERLGKWARRRPAIVGLLSLLAAVTVIAFITVLLLYQKANRQTRLTRDANQRANEQAQIAREEAQRRVEAEQVAKVGLEALGSLAGTTGQAREVIQQLWSAGNMRTIGQAIRAYEQQNGTLPPAAILDRKTGQPLLSWRVALLPYLGMGELYKRFRLDEPWDSQHNRALVDEMPSVYRVVPFTKTPTVVTQLLEAGRALDPTRLGLLTRMPAFLNTLGPGAATRLPQTYYRALVGPGTLFDGPTGRPLTEAEDGPEQTLLLVEAGPPVIWTRPDEVMIDPDQAMPRLNGPMPDVGLLVLMADGSVRNLHPDLDPRLLRRLATRHGDPLPASR